MAALGAALVAPLGSAAAQPHAAYIDELSVFGGVDRDSSERLLDRALHRAGLAPRRPIDDREPCGDHPACLAQRARIDGAAVALRVTLAEIADTVVVTMRVVRPGQPQSEPVVVEAGSLDDLEEGLVAALRSIGPATTHARPPRRTAAWALVGVGAALAVGGVYATWHAHDLRDEFFARHVDEAGAIVGISRADAEAAEREARGWQLAGHLLLAGASAAGLSATILFVRGREGDRARPAGIAVAGRF
jgi:hypothetical protein